jgi:Rhodopirellula transposase DDE domain
MRATSGEIEHRLFSFITQNWRGKPLISHQVIVQLIAATTTKAGLKVRAEIDPKSYPARHRRQGRRACRRSISRAMTSMANGNRDSFEELYNRLEIPEPGAIVYQRALSLI